MVRGSPDSVRQRWRGFRSLGPRILAVNLFALLVLAGGILYIDSFRGRLLDRRRDQLLVQAEIGARALVYADNAHEMRGLVADLGQATRARVLVFAADGRLLDDSWQHGGQTFQLRNPNDDTTARRLARSIDQAIDAVTGQETLAPFAITAQPTAADLPEVKQAEAGTTAAMLRRGPDRTVFVSAAAPIPTRGRAAPFATVQMTVATRDITYVVRDERQTSFFIFLGVLSLSLALSSFLAATIVRPLRRLAVAAQRVRLGRAREVVVPRLPGRGDEIGALSRAISDMTSALRQRIDATEAFAADMAHELKNPLASLRSAVESFASVRDPELQARLLGVIRDDVGRIDRLITDIADASRLDAELSRTRFVRVELSELVSTVVRLYGTTASGVHVLLESPPGGATVVWGDPHRLGQVVRNLVDNAISFSPPQGSVTLALAREGQDVMLRVLDQGPGVVPEAREAVFQRFYSERSDPEAFGHHSGLGLAIAKTVVEAHDGTITVAEAPGGGASFEVRLAAA